MEKNKNVVFAHDHMFFKDNETGEMYSKTSLKQSAWDRYLTCFKSVRVVSRMKYIDETIDKSKLSLSSREGVEYYTIPSISGIKNLLANYRKAWNEVEAVIMKSDCIIARLPSEIGSLAIDIARKNNIPYAIEVVACPWDGLWNYGSIQGKIYAPISYIRTKSQVSKCKYVIYVTEEFLQRRYPNKNYNTNCSNVELICDLDNEDVLLKRLENIEKNNDNIKLGLIGNLDIKSKGVDIAIKAIAKVKKSYPNVQLSIVGAGDQNKYRQLISDLSLEGIVRLEGTIPSGQKIYEWLDTVDIYLQPSFQEGLPRATIEAMSRGCMCIGSTAGGLPELLDHKLIHKKGDYRTLAKLIMKYAEDKDEKSMQAKQNFYRARNYHKEKLEEKRKEFWSAFENSDIKIKE